MDLIKVIYLGWDPVKAILIWYILYIQIQMGVLIWAYSLFRYRWGFSQSGTCTLVWYTLYSETERTQSKWYLFGTYSMFIYRRVVQSKQYCLVHTLHSDTEGDPFNIVLVWY